MNDYIIYTDKSNSPAYVDTVDSKRTQMVISVSSSLSALVVLVAAGILVAILVWRKHHNNNYSTR